MVSSKLEFCISHLRLSLTLLLPDARQERLEAPRLLDVPLLKLRQRLLQLADALQELFF